MEDALGAREEPAAAHSMIGVALGSYRLTRPLGRGGMGVVYEADDLSLGRKVAIKLLPRSACGDAQALARFRLEARAAARLNHPNVVSIYDVKEDEGRGYIVMELVLGPSADELARARGGRLPWREAAGIVAAACRGLAAAHAAGLIHRDLKPSNVICPEGGSAKLADFGLAKLARAGEGITGANDVLGTPQYMSPEQCRAEPLDERSDVYSLGATFYTLLTGKAPYEGASAIQIMFAQCSNPVPDARAVSPEVPERCAALVLRAMAKEPHDRHPSAAALLADLESLVSRRLPAQPPRSPGASEARREIAWIAAALLAGALITGGALGAVMPQDAKPVARAPAKPAPAPVKPAPQPPAPARVAPTTPPRVEPPARPDPPSSPPSEPPPEPAPAPPPPGPVGSEIACDACDSVHRHASLTGDGRIGSMVVSPAGRRVAVSIEDGERGVMLHRGDRGPPRIARWAGLPVRSLAFSPDGDAIAATLSSEGEESLRLWSIDDDRETAVSLDGEATSVAFAADGRTVAVAIAGAEPRALVRAFPRGDLVRTLRGPKKRIASVACSSDGKRVATGGEDGVFVWDASGEKTLGPVGERIACVAFSPDARHLAAGSGPGFLLVDLETGKPISERAASARVLSLAFSRDGRWLALGSESGEIAAFDTAAKTIAHRLGVRGASVRALAFTPDGKLASASDETVRMWEVAR